MGTSEFDPGEPSVEHNTPSQPPLEHDHSKAYGFAATVAVIALGAIVVTLLGSRWIQLYPLRFKFAIGCILFAASIAGVMTWRIMRNRVGLKLTPRLRMQGTAASIGPDKSLSDHERRLLDELESAFEREDPELSQALRKGQRH